MARNQASLTIEIHNIGAHTRERLVAPSACPQLAARGIVLCGLTEARRDYEFCRLRPARSEVAVTIAGSGRVFVDGRWSTFLPGHAYLMPMGVPHAFHFEPGKTWRFAWVKFASSFVPGPLPVLYPFDGKPLAATIEGLSRESTGRRNPEVLRHWADLLFAQAEAVCQGLRARLGLEALWRRVVDDLARPWTLAELARLGRRSPEVLRGICLREYGMPPMKYVTALRLREVVSLLSHVSWKLDAIAARVGYASAFALSATFKRWFGLSPREARQRLEAGELLPDPVDLKAP